MKNTTYKVSVNSNMNKIFEDLQSRVSGLRYDASTDATRIDYADKKQRSATLKFEVDKWTNKDSHAFDGYGFYIGKDNAYASVGEALSIGENRATKGGSYERKKQYYIWIRTEDEYQTLLTLIDAVNGVGVKFTADTATQKSKAEKPKRETKAVKRETKKSRNAKGAKTA